MVFYRKYRPQKISDLDSKAVRDSLYSIFSKRDFPHAFLFSGPKGLGKTSTARIVAKVINCEKHKDLKGKLEEKDIEPCNKCSECETITNGNNFDVFEIDGASNRGIDEIRDLKEKINLLPSKAFKKIYIIDEVHMLTTEAFNALLKTLEEPPAHAVFILCTTEFHKLPETIISRCFRIDFKKATHEEIARSLQRIVKGEEIKIDEDVLLEIAKMADGSFRDSSKILEELAIWAGEKKVTLALLEEKYNMLGIDKTLSDFVNLLKLKDAKKTLELIGKIADSGMDFKFFVENLINKLHVLLLAKHGVGEKQETELEVLEIKKILENLSKVYLEIKSAVLPQLPLEIFIVEWMSTDLSAATKVEVEETVEKAKTEMKTEIIRQTDSKAEVKKENSTVSKSGSFASDFINEVKNHNHLLAGVLRSCEVESGKDNLVQISAISKFHKEKLEEEKSIIILQEVAEKLTGVRQQISIVLRG